MASAMVNWVSLSGDLYPSESLRRASQALHRRATTLDHIETGAPCPRGGLQPQKGTPMAFFFIQMSDPQLGLYATVSRRNDPASNVTGFAYETERYEKAIAAANR